MSRGHPTSKMATFIALSSLDRALVKLNTISPSRLPETKRQHRKALNRFKKHLSYQCSSVSSSPGFQFAHGTFYILEMLPIHSRFKSILSAMAVIPSIYRNNFFVTLIL